MIDERKIKELIERDTPMPLRETKCKYFCPVCSRPICSKHNREFYYRAIYYCPRCGQHLDTRKLKS